LPPPPPFSELLSYIETDQSQRITVGVKISLHCPFAIVSLACVVNLADRDSGRDGRQWEASQITNRVGNVIVGSECVEVIVSNRQLSRRSMDRSVLRDCITEDISGKNITKRYR